MKKIKGTFSFFYKCFICYTLVVYALLIWVPFSGWISGFMMMTFPVIWIGHFIYLLISLLTNRKRILLPLVILLAGCVFIPRTYALHFNKSDNQKSGKKQFKVMSYNVHVFHRNSDVRQKWVQRDIRKMKKWIAAADADILCMPEYYNSNRADLLNMNKFFESKGYKYRAFLNDVENNKFTDYWGLVLLSKYPIVDKKETLFMDQNGMISADIKVDQDTVRVIGLHLYSMTLKLYYLRYERRFKQVSEIGEYTARQIKNGFINHAKEMGVLEAWIQNSPYPVIVCGDFNETPYGYVYGKTKSLLNNSFEDAGNGFGFSYNELPYYIRIDHHFYDKSKINLLNFETIDSVRYSDHYPLMGTYQIAK